MRARVVFRPGSGGLVTDAPDTFLKPESLVYANDAVLYRGMLEQRRGWAYESSVGLPSGLSSTPSPIGVSRVKFSKDVNVQTVVSCDDGTVYFAYSEPYDSAVTSISVNAPVRTAYPIARCMYRNELIFCYGDGKTPILRYSGAAGKYSFAGQTLSSATLTYAQNEATVTVAGSTFATPPPESSYLQIVVGNAVATWARVMPGATSTKATIENITHSALVTTAYATGYVYNPAVVAGGWPSVAIYNDGVCTVTKTPLSDGGAEFVATGTGTVWNDAASSFETPFSGRTALSYYNKSDRKYYLRTISEIVSNTSMKLANTPVTFAVGGGGGSVGAASRPAGVTAGTPVTTEKAPYQILSVPTWTDATVHKGSLWGTGVTQYKNRVYVAPPNWDPSLPPGETVPYDVSLNPTMRTFTVTIASPGVFTLSGHGLSSGEAVYLQTSGTLPTGLTAGTKYYVIDGGLTTNTFQLSATVNGSAINTSGTQSGTHTVGTSLFTEYGNADQGKWTLDYLDVPTSYDGDPVTALLSSSGPLLVLKESNVYGIYGTYPTFEQSLIQTGCGCIDRTAAINVGGSPFWAGSTGIWAYRGGRVVSLVENKIEREWRALMSGWVDGESYCTLGVVADHLVVSVGGLNANATGGAKNGPDSSNPSSRVLVMDIQAGEWVSRFSNVNARGFWSARVPGEADALLFVGESSGKVSDLTPAINNVKCTNRNAQTFTTASALDANSSGPQFEAWSALGLSGLAGIDGEARLIDMSVVTNVCDAGSAGSTNVDVTVAQGDGLHTPSATPSTVSVGTLSSDTTDAINRYRYRVGRSGRTHQYRIKVNTTGAACSKVEFQELVFNFRDSRMRT